MKYPKRTGYYLDHSHCRNCTLAQFAFKAGVQSHKRLKRANVLWSWRWQNLKYHVVNVIKRSRSAIGREHEEERSSCNTADLLLGHSPNGLLAPGRRETFGKSIGNVWEALVWQRDVRFANNGGDNSDKCPIRRRCI
ncbi:hypothetical protein HJC23_009026 [Cyclotella cryptica]|uniref:Uncharacterized protein n=1 Tax=Cyclotella cryptica TaxID=29204 RepID=A0ABD3QZ65_9STRA